MSCPCGHATACIYENSQKCALKMVNLLYSNYSIIKIKWGDTSMPASPWGGWGVNGAGRGGGGGPTPASSWPQLWRDKRSSSSSHTHWPQVTDWGVCRQGFQTPVCLIPTPQSFTASPILRQALTVQKCTDFPEPVGKGRGAPLTHEETTRVITHPKARASTQTQVYLTL